MPLPSPAISILPLIHLSFAIRPFKAPMMNEDVTLMKMAITMTMIEEVKPALTAK